MINKLKELLSKPDAELRAKLEQLTAEAEQAALNDARSAWLKTMLADRLLTPDAAARAADLWTPENEPHITALLRALGPPPVSSPNHAANAADPVEQLANTLLTDYATAAQRYVEKAE